MQFNSQAADKLQNAGGFAFDGGLNRQLATVIEDTITIASLTSRLI
jgi:hypothetical protein